MNRSTRLAVLLATLLSASPVFAAQWVTSWAASPLPPAAGMGPLPGTPSFDNQTIRQVLRLNQSPSCQVLIITL